jgi:hypothetical protein
MIVIVLCLIEKETTEAERGAERGERDGQVELHFCLIKDTNDGGNRLRYKSNIRFRTSDGQLI